MKTKNIALGILALLLAIGSAFASLSTVQEAYVRARVNGPDDPITCFNTGRVCDNSGGFVCRVQLNVQTGPNITTKTYRGVSCTLPLTDTSSPLIVSSISVYELVEF